VPGLTEYLAERYTATLTAEDLFAYLAAVLSHPGYTSTFATDLTVPGLRVPLTSNPQVFKDTVAAGKQVLWLHSYGQRFYNPADNRPRRAPRMPHGRAPLVLGGYPIPGDESHMPDVLKYDPDKQELIVGSGRISNVTSRMYEYDLSGVNVLNKWFSYRRKNRERPVIGDRRSSPLQQIQATAWRAEYTSELIDLLNVLGLLTELEPRQAQLLRTILDGPLINVDDLTTANILPVPSEARTPPKAHPRINTEGTLDLGLPDT
jgi:Type ISP C-terminal specificity domain